MKYAIEDTFETTPEHFWETFFSDAYTAALWPALDIEWELLHFDRQGEGESLVIERKARLTPNREVPRFLRSMLDRAVSYVESNRYEARTHEMPTEIEPNIMPDRIENRGVLRLERLGDGKINRIWEGTCVAKVPLIGGHIETMLVDLTKDSYRKATTFTRDWLRAHPAG